ncbi:type I-E CRISPR-associated protein Cse2/CasB [Geobacter anodireducens]|uniref:type I-E CRISPR-associated protein Cse2/CasB n=1 Tax=Geobacter soli TaxID=1510391 RepID=UPI0009E50933|nr:type I-E CRISPR-associated protein Cse2/CasB [Geobacter soli]
MEQKLKNRFLNDPSDCEQLLAWWKWLDDNRGDRARLRRVESPDDVLLTGAFSRFLSEMPEKWSESRQLSSSALVAAIVAQVRTNNEVSSFAVQLATPKDGGDKPRMSELRFQQLQKSHDPAEFFRRLLRAVRMLDGNVNILSLANDVLHWMNEYRKGVDRNPKNRLTFCWANDYYLTLLKKQSKAENKGGNTP